MIKNLFTLCAAVVLFGVDTVADGTDDHRALRGLDAEEFNHPFEKNLRELQTKLKCVCQNSTTETNDCDHHGYIYKLSNSNVVVGGTSSFEYTLTRCNSTGGKRFLNSFEIYPPRDLCPSSTLKVIDGQCSCMSNDTAKCEIGSPNFANITACEVGARAAGCSNIKTLLKGESVVLKFNVAGVTGLAASRIYSSFTSTAYPTCAQLCIVGPTCRPLIGDLKVSCVAGTEAHHQVSYTIINGTAPFTTTVYCDTGLAKVLNGTVSPPDPTKGLNTLQIEPCHHTITVNVQDKNGCTGMNLTSTQDNHACGQYNDCVTNCKVSPVALEVGGCGLTAVPPYLTNKDDVYNFTGDCDTNLELVHKNDTYSPEAKAPNFCPPKGVTVSRQYYLALAGVELSRTQCNQTFIAVQKAPPVFIGACANQTNIPTIKVGCKNTTIPASGLCQYHPACFSNLTLNATFTCCYKNGALHRKWTATDFCKNVATRKQDVKFAAVTCF